MSLAVDDVSELRKDAEEKLLHIKIDYCIQILTLYEFCCCCSFDKKQIREIMINSKKDKNVFSKKSTFSASGFRISPDPNASIPDNSLLSIENAIITIFNSQNNYCCYVEKKDLKTNLHELENEEGRFEKIKKSFIGLNFKFCLAKPCNCKCCENQSK